MLFPMSLGRHQDTIVAPITALGGAVGVLRLSGPSALAVARAVFSGPEPEPRRAVYGAFSQGDDGLLVYFPAGSSYTGEESVEMSVHGSPASVYALVAACVAEGARRAEPGEFTLRAFMNGRMDLTQAEGVRDTVNAATDAQLRQANLLREGALRDTVRSLRHDLVGVLAMVEASTDFSEEVGEVDKVAALDKCSTVWDRTFELVQTASAARIVREGVSVAIAGLPNAGKSSLLNALIGSDRAIVTEVPGTTRDTVEETVDLFGVPARLIDTAGLRNTEDFVEALGVERSRNAIENSDVVWYVYDSSLGWQNADDALVSAIERPVIIVRSKCDLGGSGEGLAVSSTDRKGLNELLKATSERVRPGEASALVNSRHAPLLRDALQSLEQAMTTLSSPFPSDLVAVDLQGAIRTLGEITGETASPDVIDRIFRDFCIGK